MSTLSKNMTALFLAATVATSAIAADSDNTPVKPDNWDDLTTSNQYDDKNNALKEISSKINQLSFIEFEGENHTIGMGNKIFIGTNPDNPHAYTRYSEHIDFRTRLFHTDTNNSVPFNHLDETVQADFNKVRNDACGTLSTENIAHIKTDIQQHVDTFGSGVSVERLDKQADDLEHFKEQHCP